MNHQFMYTRFEEEYRRYPPVVESTDTRKFNTELHEGSLGRWWDPRTPETKLPGELKFSDKDEPFLILLDNAQEITEPSINNSPIMHGYTTDGTKVTLTDCTSLGLSGSFGSSPKSLRIEARAAFIGCHFESKENICLRGLEVIFDGEDTWARYAGFNHKWDQMENGWRKFNLEYEFPPTLTASVGDYTIKAEPLFDVNRESMFKYSLCQTIHFRIEAEEQKPFDELYDVYWKLRNFLSFASAYAINPLSFRGATRTTEWTKGLDYEISIRRDVRRVIANEIRHPAEALFTLRDVLSYFETCIQAWFNNAEELEPVHNLFFGTVYKKGMYLESQLLQAAHALEVLHRRQSSRSVYLEEEEFQDFLGSLHQTLNDHGITDGPKDSFKTKMKYMNEYSLRKRIRELLKELNGLLSEIIPDEGEFVQKLVDTRNYLVHYDTELEESRVSGTALFRLIMQARFILEVYLLKSLELPDPIVSGIVSNRLRFHPFRNVLRDD